ncbi:MAG: hypothetical protein EBR82_46550 [Caulobacteraceae bacterium]|nr:hypothetical protein [Caulobacteraceae bacterium]NDG33157.1 hypothetical protein [bacterium]
MAEWVVVEDNKITEYYDVLPTNWRHISGLNLSSNDEEFMKSLGWFKVITEGNFNPNSQLLLGYNYRIQDGKVYKTPNARDFTEEEIQQSIQGAKNAFFLDLRSTRNKLLQDSDYTQLNDVYQNMSEQERIEWQQYRQALRDLPSDYTEVTSIQWPARPK